MDGQRGEANAPKGGAKESSVRLGISNSLGKKRRSNCCGETGGERGKKVREARMADCTAVAKRDPRLRWWKAKSRSKRSRV